MAQYIIKKIATKWIISTVALIFAIVGAVIGIFTFFLVPTEAAAGLGFGAKLLAFLIFIVLYAVIMVVGILIVVWLYNKLAPSTGAITVEMEAKEE